MISIRSASSVRIERRVPNPEADGSSPSQTAILSLQTDLLPIRGHETRGEHAAWWHCKNCGKKWVAMNTPRACVDCGGQTFFRNCNLVQVGQALVDQVRRNAEWRQRWSQKMALR